VKDPRDFALFFTLCRGDGLLYGVLLAWMIRSGQTSIPLNVRIALCYAGLAVFALGFLMVYRVDYLLFTVGLSLLGPLFFCTVALSIMHERGPLAAVTKTGLLRWIGIRTYAIYLFHIPALLSVRGFFELTDINPHGLVRPIALALTLACAAASWRLLEAPLINLGHRLKYGRGAKQLILRLSDR
jgi:peptidoglycan/LPS O-acetylase OafA/YrhL